ncbi:thioredoxin family protein [Aureimonas altamirensis]|uniref:thioredoxin family protein n=1 Tax=Aureimonas altamirensis TaxID=370622 RepID=UPI002036D2F0|nr:thioredoxin family protein [Aureimonas altamirensis]MCM2505430.1 thioredoxin family protein [Aureimonas altamirensis]
MPQTPSNPIQLGSSLPDFVLPTHDGGRITPADFAGASALLVAFISNRCPFVVLIREELAAYARDYAEKGVAVLAINSNDATLYPEEASAALAREASEQGYAFPYVKDATQDVARAFLAACTPDLFLYDGARRLAYHGQFDDARPGNGKPVTGADLRRASDAILAGRSPVAAQLPSIGCNIKWLPAEILPDQRKAS